MSTNYGEVDYTIKNISIVIILIQEVASDFGWTKVGNNGLEITYKTKMSILSLGETLKIVIKKEKGVLLILSESNQITDWGKSKQNVTDFIVGYRKKIGIFITGLIQCYPKYKDQILNGTISFGMPFELVKILIGEPDKANQTGVKNKIVMKCFYGRYCSSRGTEKFQAEIDFEDGLVIAWKDL